MPTRYCITLIHGTRLRVPGARWLPHTRIVRGGWTEPGSWLRRTLELNFQRTLEIPCDAIAWCSHNWSGANSHAARLAAGRDLEEQLRGQITQYPEARHIIIAHSHGGNVALFALRDVELQKRISRVITLNTPFLRGSVRSLASIAIGSPALLLLLAPLMILPFLLALSVGRPSWWAIVFLPMSMFAGAVCIHLLSRQFNIRHRIDRLQAIMRRLRPPVIENTPISCLTSASDEVDDLFQFFSAITSGLLMMLRIRVVLFVWAVLLIAHELAYLCWGRNFSFFELVPLPLIGEMLEKPLAISPPPAFLSSEGLRRIPLWLLSSSCWLFAALMAIQGTSWLHLRYAIGIKAAGFSNAIYIRLVTDAIPIRARKVELKEIDVTEVERLSHNVSHGNDAILREIWLLLSRDHRLQEKIEADCYQGGNAAGGCDGQDKMRQASPSDNIEQPSALEREQ